MRAYLKQETKGVVDDEDADPVLATESAGQPRMARIA
jgi:hypothetical protein